MGEMQIQVLAKAKVLGCPIDAGFVKNGDDNTIVVYGKADATRADELSITELFTQLATMVSFGAISQETLKTQLTDQLPEGLKSALDKIKLQLKEAYFVTSSKKPSAGAQPELKGTTEFAFWFDINLHGVTAGLPISLDSISIKLWQTKNATILDEMKISAMKKLLDSARDLPKEDKPDAKPKTQ